MLRSLILVCLLASPVFAADDILVADFESETYGDWTVTGSAFGPGPAAGTLPGQMQVEGFRGQRLVNTFFEGDGSTGTLTSPPIKLEREYLTFLIGGGGYPEKTCINLLVDDDVARTAVGPNTVSGGSERLELSYWDVRDLIGRTATIQIVDRATGGWGHINVDHLVLTDTKPSVPIRQASLTRSITCEQQYLLIPIRTGARSCQIDLAVDGENVREFDVELAESAEAADFWSFLDLTPFAGQQAKLTVRGASEEMLALIKQSVEIPGDDDFYNESLRPQFHFSQKLGWNNDPNGMVYHDGKWHLYFQHNPYGWNWGNMHWGHAVSPDLVHWEQQPIAIYNNRRGDWAFSGGAVVDVHNTAGWQKGDEPVIVASWTSTGRGECLSYSTDGGRTFTEYEGNPVVRHQGRDPKIIWYEPGRHWVMAVYDESDAAGQAIAFYSSTDLKSWGLTSKLSGYFECPELLELPVDGDADNSKWIVFAADARYAIGRFDGKTFTPEHDGKHQVHFGEYYASQLFSNAPDDRRIQIGWVRIAMPDMPFNQTFSFPHELTLRTTDDGVRLFAEPVREIEQLHRRSHEMENVQLADGKTTDIPAEGQLFDIRATFDVGTAQSVGLDIGGEKISYDVSAAKLDGAPLDLVDGKLTLQVLVDRPMLEIIGNQGRVYITRPRAKPGDGSPIRAWATGGQARLLRVVVHELDSIWAVTDE